MEKLPQNWELVDEYEGNFIFEDNAKQFQISIDDMGGFVPKYSVYFQQLEGTFIKIGFESGAYSTHALDEREAIMKAAEMMLFINSKTPDLEHH